MPCQGGHSYRDNSQDYIDKIDKLTQKLCFLSASLYSEGLLEKYGNPEIVEWHQKHMHQDEVRVQSEMERVFIEHPERIDKPEGVADDFYRRALEIHPVSEYHRKWFISSAKEISEKVYNVFVTKNQLKKTKMEALAKLSVEERQLLGIIT